MHTTYIFRVPGVDWWQQSTGYIYVTDVDKKGFLNVVQARSQGMLRKETIMQTTHTKKHGVIFASSKYNSMGHNWTMKNLLYAED